MPSTKVWKILLTGHILVHGQWWRPKHYLLAGVWLLKQRERLAEAATVFLLLLIRMSDHFKKEVTVYSNTAWSPLALGWGNETSLKQRTPTKKCEKLKWQGCVDSLLNEWREWIEIYIYIAPFIYTVSLRTKEFAADLLYQHSRTGEWSRIGSNPILSRNRPNKNSGEMQRTCVNLKKGGKQGSKSRALHAWKTRKWGRYWIIFLSFYHDSRNETKQRIQKIN